MSDVPEARKRLREIALRLLQRDLFEEDFGPAEIALFLLQDVEPLLHREPPSRGMKVEPKSQTLTHELRVAMAKYAFAHPEKSFQEIADHFNVNQARPSCAAQHWQAGLLTEKFDKSDPRKR